MFFIFSFVLALKIIDAQMLFWSVFLKMHKKIIINCQKRPKWRFWWWITLFCSSIVFNPFPGQNIHGVRFSWKFRTKYLMRFETNVSRQFFYLDPLFLATSEKVHVPTGTRARIPCIFHFFWNWLNFGDFLRFFWRN